MLQNGLMTSRNLTEKNKQRRKIKKRVNKQGQTLADFFIRIVGYWSAAEPVRDNSKRYDKFGELKRWLRIERKEVYSLAMLAVVVVLSSCEFKSSDAERDSVLRNELCSD